MVTDQLRDRHLLLILDTCEHLLGACASLVAALLPLCPKLQVLATSREPLRVPGEAAVAVGPLRLADALRLFGQRPAEAGVEIAPQNRAAVASIACSWTSCRWPSSWQRPNCRTGPAEPEPEPDRSWQRCWPG